MQSRDVAKLILERWPGQNNVLDRRRGGEKSSRERFYSSSRNKTQAGVEPEGRAGRASHPGTL